MAFYYCSIPVLGSILERQQVWLSDLRRMNDPNELVWARDRIESALRRDIGLSPALKRIATDAMGIGLSGSPVYFASCFSENGDSVSQWREYADRGRGVALGFDLDAMCDADPDFLSVESVGYADTIGEGAIAQWEHLAREYLDELRTTMGCLVFGEPPKGHSWTPDERGLIAHGTSAADCLLPFEQNLGVLASNVAWALSEEDSAPFVSSGPVLASIDDALGLLWGAGYGSAADLMCAELEISGSRAAEAELRRGFERIRDFCTGDYFPQGTMDTAIPGYEALLAGNPLEFEDPEGNCRLFFEIFHCGEKRLLELIWEHNDVFDNAAAALNSHFLAGIKGPGYESEMEHRLILTADRTFKDLYKCDRGLRDVFEHDMRMTGNGAVERHKMTFPAEALVGIVTGPNCELTYGELDLFCSLKGRRYPNLTRDSFVRSQNAIR